ncbi:MAG: hypothetical protein AAFR22_07120, partial [Chloroflexota bacterium]
EKLVQQYDSFFADYTRTPVLVLNTTDINIVQDVDARKDVIQRVRTEFDNIMADQPTQTPLL